MPTLRISPPSEKQALFLKAQTMHVGYGGARGGGKSWGVRTKAKLLSLKYGRPDADSDGIKILIVRRTFPELVNNHINPLRTELHGIARYNKTEKVFTFPNGATIKFGYCNNDKDLDQYQGAEYDVIFLDEATQLKEEWIKKIIACVRGVNSFPKRVYYTCNPGGASHAYFKRLFIDKRYEDGEHPEDYTFIQALVTDNKALMASQPDYIKQLEALPPKLRDAWLHGRWDIFQGQFFEDFRTTPDLERCKAANLTQEEAQEQRRFIHVIEPFEIPDGWKIYRSFDWGYNKPFSCGWWAVDYDGVVYRILELYGCTQTPNEGVKWTPPQVFAEIHRIETEHRWLAGKKIHGIADPAIWDAETGESIADVAARHQVWFSPGDHKRIPGWMQVHYRLAFDDNGYPMMYVFSNCKAFVRTLPLLQYDEHKPEDLDTDGEDHVADEVRYFCMSRPIKPAHAAAYDDYANTPTAMFLDIPKEEIKAAPKRLRMEIIDVD